MAGPGMITLTRTEEYSNNAERELREIRRDRDFTDIDIVVGERTFPCHRVTLAVNSPMLKRMLKSDMKEVHEGAINLHHLQSDIMEIVIDYIYYGTITFHDDKLMGLIYAADYLLMDELKRRCVAQVLSLLSPENVLSWLEVGVRLNIDEIKSQCKEMMISHMPEISDQADFLNMSYATIHDLFSYELPSDTAYDDARLFAVMQWVRHDTNNRIMHLEHLIHPAQLAKCSKQGIYAFSYFYEVSPKKVGMFSADYQQNIRKITDSALRDIMMPPDKFIIVGGHLELQKVNRTCWELDKIESRQVTEMTEVPYDELSSYHSVCESFYGFIITGGENSDLCIEYNSGSKSWSMLKRMRRKRHGHGSICIRGVLYVFGGLTAGKVTKSVECLVLDHWMSARYWQNNTDLPIPVQYPKVANIKKKVYVLDATSTTKQLFEFDTEKNTWRELAPIPVDNCSTASMATVYDTLCVAGGGPSRVCAFYKPAINTWWEGQQPSLDHTHGALVFHDNKLFLLGGRQTDAIEEYSLKDNTWSA